MSQRLRLLTTGTHATVRKNKRATLPNWNVGWNQLERTVSLKVGRVCVLFFVFFTILRVLHRSNPEHDYSCSWNPANPSKQKIKTVKPKLYESNPCEKKSNPATDQTDLPNKRKSDPSPISTSPSTTDFPYQTHQTHCRSTHQTHRRSTHPPPPREPDLHRHRTRLSSSWIYILSSSLASLRRRSSSLPFFGGCGTL